LVSEVYCPIIRIIIRNDTALKGAGFDLGNHEPALGRQDLPEVDMGIREKVVFVFSPAPSLLSWAVFPGHIRLHFDGI
jgi:hypothetical protein